VARDEETLDDEKTPHVKAAAQCQYFVLSPRPSLESPTRPTSASDENADHNVTRSRVGAAKGPVKKAPPGGAVKKVPPIARPLTPTKNRRTTGDAATPAGGAAPLSARTPAQTPARTPARATPARTTPARTTPARTPDAKSVLNDDDYLNTSVYSVSASMYSESSNMSRLTQLSRKSISKRHLSTKELEELEVEEKRRQVNEQMRRNQVNCRKALHAADLNSAGRVQSTTKLTAPKEFNLSCPPTPRSPPGTPAPSCAASECGSTKGENFSRSLRSASSQSLQQPVERWKPQLTVPRGPDLRTVRRLSSGRRRVSSCPPDEADSLSVSTLSVSSIGTARKAMSRPVSRASTPERRREEVKVPTSSAAKAAAKAPAATPRSKAATSSSGQKAGGASSTREEKAQRAREMAQKRKEEEAKANKAKMFVFKRSSTPDGAKSTTSMLSVGSCQSLRSNGSIKPSTGEASVSSGRPQSARVRRPSFGSATPRPCCA